MVGIPRQGGDEEVAAAVVPAAGAPFDEAELLAHARRNLGGYKVPRRIVVVDELPRSLIGKVLRRQVRERVLAGVGDAGATPSAQVSRLPDLPFLPSGGDPRRLSSRGERLSSAVMLRSSSALG